MRKCPCGEPLANDEDEFCPWCQIEIDKDEERERMCADHEWRLELERDGEYVD